MRQHTVHDVGAIVNAELWDQCSSNQEAHVTRDTPGLSGHSPPGSPKPRSSRSTRIAKPVDQRHDVDILNPQSKSHRELRRTVSETRSPIASASWNFQKRLFVWCSCNVAVWHATSPTAHWTMQPPHQTLSEFCHLQINGSISPSPARSLLDC